MHLTPGRKQSSQVKPFLASFDCSHEHTLEHFFEVRALVKAEADSPYNEHFAYRQFKHSRSAGEQKKEADSADRQSIDVGPNICFV